MNLMSAGSPATVTVTGSCGLGRLVKGVAEDGDVPVASAGCTFPSPVMNSVEGSVRLALENGALTKPFDMKMPGAAAVMFKVYETLIGVSHRQSNLSGRDFVGDLYVHLPRGDVVERQKHRLSADVDSGLDPRKYSGKGTTAAD